MRITRQALAAATAVGLAAAGGSAFTAANTGTPTSSLGQASTVTSGFAVSGVKYVLDDFTRSDYLITVTFSLTATATHDVAKQARIRVVKPTSTTGDYYSCNVAAAVGQVTAVSCPINNGAAGTGGVLVSTVNALDIVATSEQAA